MSPVPEKGTALVTGASSGIGAVYADRLARRGHNLILVARNCANLAHVAERIGMVTDRSIRTVAADLTHAPDLARIEEVLLTDPAITLLVNNAGMGAIGPLIGCDPETIARLVSLNVAAPTRLAHAAAVAFAGRGAGAIINISSIVALAPDMLNSAYSASKAYMLAFSQALQHELEAEGVRVQAVLPGITATAFWDQLGRPADQLPASMVMRAEDMVDAALAGFDVGETVTIPSLPEVAEWQEFETARNTLRPHLSRAVPATRYLQHRIQA